MTALPKNNDDDRPEIFQILSEIQESRTDHLLAENSPIYRQRRELEQRIVEAQVAITRLQTNCTHLVAYEPRPGFSEDKDTYKRHCPECGLDFIAPA